MHAERSAGEFAVLSRQGDPVLLPGKIFQGNPSLYKPSQINCRQHFTPGCSRSCSRVTFDIMRTASASCDRRSFFRIGFRPPWHVCGSEAHRFLCSHRILVPHATLSRKRVTISFNGPALDSTATSTRSRESGEYDRMKPHTCSSRNLYTS